MDKYMETITHLNLNISGINLGRLLALEINHVVNEHATAIIKCEVENSRARKILQGVDEKRLVEITTTAKGQPKNLFKGVITNVSLDTLSKYSIMTVCCKSGSYLSDIEKNSRSFQNTQKKYETIMNKVLRDSAIATMRVADTAIGRMIVQCNETNWEFCKRMASMFGAPIITTIDSIKPTFYIGFPDIYDEVNVEYGELVTESDTNSTCMNTTQYVFLGNEIIYNNTTLRVKWVKASLEKGVLITTIGLGNRKDFVQKPIANNQISGKMYTGKVQDVKKDKVKVHLVDVDDSFDASGNVWLPYSTAYSSTDGSGFYSMPAKGDTVRVFFPGADEGSAFAASSVSVNHADKTTHKQWMGPNGKQLLLTEEGIFIGNNSGNSRIFINLSDENGISISSDNNITICAKNNLSLISNNNIAISAENDILISSAESYIDINPKGIEMGAENIVIK